MSEPIGDRIARYLGRRLGELSGSFVDGLFWGMGFYLVLEALDANIVIHIGALQ